MYYIHAVLLEGCAYSINAESLLRQYNIKYRSTVLDNTNKDKFKSTQLSTFPQIFLKKHNSNGSQYIGGYDELDELFRTFYKQRLVDSNIIRIQNKYKISRKATLRLVELINSA